MECQGASSEAVRGCTDSHCALWPHRLPEQSAQAPEKANAADKLSQRESARQRLRAVRRHCLSCAASRAEVRACTARESCTLWSYRFGVRPETYLAVKERCLHPRALSLFT